MTGSIFETPLALLVIAAVGRLALSLLPPGHVGSHRLRDLPTTWAASHMLGLATIESLSRWPAVLDFELPDILALALVAAIALFRVATLPGAIVPAHAVPLARAGVVARGLWVGAALLLLWQTAEALQGERTWQEFAHEPFEATPIVVDAASLAALYLLVDHGLGVARRAPLGRALVVLLLAAVTTTNAMFAGAGELCSRALFLGAGAAFLVALQRRADRRALALGAIAFATSADWRLLSQAPTLCALVTCVLTAPPLMRRRALTWCAGAAALLALPALIDAVRFPPTHVGSPGQAFANLGPLLGELVRMPQGALWILALACLGLKLSGFAGGERRPVRRAGEIEPPVPELAALGTLLVATVAGAILALVIWNASSGSPDPGTTRSLFLTLTPLGALVIGLVLVRAERVDVGSAG